MASQRWFHSLRKVLFSTRSIFLVGHRHIFDINVPQFSLWFWYQCPNSCPNHFYQVLWTDIYPDFLNSILTLLLLYAHNIDSINAHISSVSVKLSQCIWYLNWADETSVPYGLEFWYQVSHLMPQNFDIVPLWLSHSHHTACIVRG